MSRRRETEDEYAGLTVPEGQAVDHQHPAVAAQVREPLHRRLLLHCLHRQAGGQARRGQQGREGRAAAGAKQHGAGAAGTKLYSQTV